MSTASARRKRARKGRTDNSSLAVIGAVVAGVLLVALVVALIATSGGDDSDEAATEQIEAAQVAVVGTALPPYGDGTDAAEGAVAPTLEGSSFAGEPLAVAPGDGRGKAVLFLAHWCPVCQAEVPVVQEWIDGGGLPESVDLVSVATSIDPAAPNYPPQDWLAREGWTSPTLIDPDDAAAAAYGLTGFPHWVFVDGDGTVASRASGELSVEELQARVDAIAG